MATSSNPEPPEESQAEPGSLPPQEEETVGEEVTRRTWGLPVLIFVPAAVVFGVSFLVLLTDLFPSTFFVLVRGSGLVQYDTALANGSQLPEQALFVSTLAISILVSRLLISSWRARPFTLATMVAVVAAGIIGSAIYPQSPIVVLMGFGGLLLLIYGAFQSDVLFGVSPRNVSSAIILVFLFIATSIAAGSALRWVINGFDGEKPLSGSNWALSLIDVKLFNLEFWALPRLTVLFLLGWVLALASPWYLDYVVEFVRSIFPSIAKLRRRPRFPDTTDWPTTRVLLPLSVIATIFVCVYPYSSGINPTPTLVGVDNPKFYLPSLNTMLAENATAAIRFAFSNDRSLFLLLPYALGEALHSATLALEVTPAILGVLLVISTYLFVRVVAENELMAGTSAMFAAFSFQVTAGIDAAFYANWLAISEVMLFLAVFCRGLDRLNRYYLFAAVILSITVLFTHPWTWGVLMGIVAVYFVFTIIQSRGEFLRVHWRGIGIFTAFVLAVSLVVGELKTFLPTGSGYAELQPDINTLDPSNFLRALSTLQTTFQIFLGGALANPVVIILAIIGAVTLVDLGRAFDRVLLSWVIVSTAGIMFTGVSASFLQARVFYIVPFQIFAAIGFVRLIRFIESNFAERARISWRGEAIVLLSYVTMFSILLSYALRIVGFLYV